MLFIESLVKKCDELLQPLVVVGECKQSANQIGYRFTMPEGQEIGAGEFSEDYRDEIARRLFDHVRTHVAQKNAPLVGVSVKHDRSSDAAYDYIAAMLYFDVCNGEEKPYITLADLPPL
jgi:hypothetical protein